MADGEVVAGEYRVAFGESVGFLGSVGQVPPSLYVTALFSLCVIRDGPVQFVARGPKTQMLCRGMSNPMGHGNGKCQTYDGAVWAIRVAALLREPRRLHTRSGHCLGNRDEAHGARGNTL